MLDIEKTIQEMTIAEKVSLLAGRDFWHTVPIKRLDIPAVRMSDGPNGVRGIRFFNGTPSSCFPCSTAMGATWDIDLLKAVGNALGDECRAKGAHLLLAPTVNTQRSPLGGRGFESFAEDPTLNGTLAASYIKGVQERNVGATIKHYVANDQEFERFSIDSRVSERALREIYLKPFEIAVKQAKPWAVMTAYNRVNGTHASENKFLLQQILRDEWGFKGMVMSDWIGVYSVAEAVLAGLDLEMPGPTVMRGAALQRALTGERLFEKDIDICLGRVLKVVQQAQSSGIPFNAEEKALDTPAVRSLLRTAAAESIVLLKNDKDILPLSLQSGKKLAVIGPNAKISQPSGGGSAALRSTYTISALSAIEKAAKEIGMEVSYEIGCASHRYQPYLDSYLEQQNGKPGFLVEFFNEDFVGRPDLQPVYSTPSENTRCFFTDGLPSTINMTCYVKLTATFIPDEAGEWEFGLAAAGQADLYIDGKKIIDNTHNQEAGELFFGAGSTERLGSVDNLKKGQKYSLEVRFSNTKPVSRASPFTTRGGIRLGGMKKVHQEANLQAAVDLAKASDSVVLVAGINADWESEGFDRKHMNLPGISDKLITEVTKANPNAVVVIQSGTPIEMPWIDSTSTLVHAWYGGNELGHGLSDVLFGQINPSGKLPLSFPKRLSDNPSYTTFPGWNGVTLYGEDIYVGYRHYEKVDLSVLFPFGFGLSYTKFEYGKLNVDETIAKDGSLDISFEVKNVGSVDGKETVQVYVSDAQSSLPRAVKELRGFTKVTLRPGEAKIAKVNLTKEAFGFFDDRQNSWIAEKGKFGILVAASSQDVRLRAEVELKEDLTWI